MVCRVSVDKPKARLGYFARVCWVRVKIRFGGLYSMLSISLKLGLGILQGLLGRVKFGLGGLQIRLSGL